MNNCVLDDNMLRHISRIYAEAEGSAIIDNFETEALTAKDAKDIRDRIIQKAIELKTRKRFNNNVLKRVAAVVLILGVSAGMVFTFSEEARAMVIKWYREVIGDHIVYHIDDQEPGLAFTVPELKWIPEGFIQEEINEEADSFDALFRNSEGKVIDFGCYLSSSVTFMEMITPEDNLEKIELNGREYDYYQTLDEGEYSFIIWNEEKYDTVCVLGSTLDRSDMIRIAENVVFGDESKGGE
ncbi:MAG: DUF4367 domain-containing protein [Firmicutes bacterium]|nr:DUF4367 domain-containing protein [Bacillota bacterium]